MFWYHPQIHFDSIWSCEGQIHTCVFPTSHPHYALCSSVFPGWNTRQKWKKKLTQHDIASYTAKRHQLVCWQASISAKWVVGGVCKVFACLLGSYIASLGTELLIAALTSEVECIKNIKK